MDQIIVVDDGRIVERGTHTSLVALGGLYADMYRRQLLSEEMADDEVPDDEVPDDEVPDEGDETSHMTPQPGGGLSGSFGRPAEE